MNKMKRWSVLLLALLLLVTAAAGCGGGTADPAENPADKTQNTTEEEIPASETLTYSDGEVTLHFTLTEDGHWQWRDDVDFPLDEQYINDMVVLLGQMQQAQPLRKPGKRSEYGLDSKKKYLHATGADGMELTLYFGDKNKAGQRYFRRSDREKDIYLAPKEMTAALSRSIYDMMKLPAMPELETERMHTIVVNGPKVKFSAKQSDGKWLSQGKDVTKKIEPLAEMLMTLQMDRCIDYRPSKGVDKLCGLRDPRAVVRLEYTNTVGVESTLRMEVGSIRGEGRYVRLEGDSTIYLVAREKLQPLFRLADHGI